MADDGAPTVDGSSCLPMLLLLAVVGEECCSACTENMKKSGLDNV